jgi:hypothetical protein
MADSDANKAAIEYWDRVAASGKRGADAQTVDRDRDRDRSRERNSRERAAEISIER